MYIQLARTGLNFQSWRWLKCMRGSLVYCGCISHCCLSFRSKPLAVFKTGIMAYPSALMEVTQE